jgi:hypothetical protein
LRSHNIALHDRVTFRLIRQVGDEEDDEWAEEDEDEEGSEEDVQEEDHVKWDEYVFKIEAHAPNGDIK